jgi:hypothetical protein
MALLKRHHVADMSGDGRFFEVYPAGTLSMWGISRDGYKGKTAMGLAARTRILTAMRTAMPWLEVTEEYARSDDFLDSFIASLTARAAAQGFTMPPEASQSLAASREGWIHLPTRFPTL